MFLRFIGFLISFLAAASGFNFFCFMMVGFIDPRSLTDLYLFITFSGLTFMGIFFYLKSYTDFYEKYGLESYQMEKDQKYMSEEAFREKYNA